MVSCNRLIRRAVLLPPLSMLNYTRNHHNNMTDINYGWFIILLCKIQPSINYKQFWMFILVLANDFKCLPHQLRQPASHLFFFLDSIPLNWMHVLLSYRKEISNNCIWPSYICCTNRSNDFAWSFNCRAEKLTLLVPLPYFPLYSNDVLVQ